MKQNYQTVFQYLMLVAIFVMQLINMPVEQRAQAFKLSMQALDSLNTKIAIEIKNDTSVMKDTIILTPIVDTVKVDTTQSK